MTTEKSTHTDENPCYTDYAIQEFTLGRLSDSTRKGIEAHLGQCVLCEMAHQETQRELAYFQQLQLMAEGKTDTPCLEQFEVADYIDRNSDESHRKHVESHVSSCPKCRNALVELYRGIQDVTTELHSNPSQIVPEPAQKPEIIILTMPKRTQPEKEEKLPIFPFRSTGTSE